MESLSGRLLVAAPALRDPNFVRTVVLLLDHGEPGALGVVLNRPSEMPVDDVLPRWSAAVVPPAVLYSGGPVSTGAAIALARRRPAVVPAGFAPLNDGLGTVDLDADPAEVRPGLERLRIFAGYAGWGAGQLESEIEEGAWFVVDAWPEDAFHPQPELLWRAVVRRQNGPLRMLFTMPLDPTDN